MRRNIKITKQNQTPTRRYTHIFSISLFVLMLLIVLLCGSCVTNQSKNSEIDKDDEIVVAITLMDYGFPFFQDILAMAKLKAEQMNVKLIDLDGKGSMENQANIINDFLYAMEVDVICLNPVDSEAVGSLVLEANDMDIPIVTVDVGTGSGYVNAHVASNNVEIGKVAARYTIEQLKKKYGDARGTVIAVGYPQISSMRQRIQGFEEVLSDYSSIELVIRNPIKLNSDKNMRLMDDLIQSYPMGSVDIVFGASGTTTSGLLAATEAAGRTDFQLISVDNPPEIMNKLSDENSVLTATVVQFPTQMAEQAIEICVRIAKGENIKNKEVNTQIELVTKETASDYLSRMKDIELMLDPYKH